ncbi:CAP domain-containing protein [Cytobacillus spongiae]|uniref:CAP domain-containing protein n=1 Tax=Cytobacillus spongiae TaxID=2901381 RepID=UPI001F2E4F1A|nr:CAP domain-containing protein [Cytobacillus spongiae]UII57285.1 CAP domain-containing protein [Cytobacillus spongiae]
MKEANNPNIFLPDEGLLTLMGKNVSELETTLGEPDRVDPSYYDYEWWVYQQDFNYYVQFGVKDSIVVTGYAIGQDVNVSPFAIGQSSAQLFSAYTFNPNFDLEFNGNPYRFEMSEDDLNTQPILQVGDIFVQLYIDKFTETLSSIRFLDAETLLKHRPYELVYRGELIEPASVEGAKELLIEEGKERQIFDITNMMRKRHNLSILEWDEATAVVALGHSKDMFESEDFSHTSKTYGDLADRLDAGKVIYQLAGENIAANYIDAPAVVEGWLNSKGHRESMLNNDFTHLGVGVYKKHYTQNFIQKWKE